MNGLTAFALCFSLLLPAAAGQKPPTGPRGGAAGVDRLVALKITGTKRYTDKEILAASGLQMGQNAADGDFKEAVRRLGNSGVFSDVVYSYSSSSTGVKLELQVTDIENSKLVHTHFENFVWFTDEELRAALEPRAPLFKQVLPLAGDLPQHVSEALQAILTERHFPGRVDFLREGDESGGALRGIDYRIEEISFRIRNVEFRGATPEQVVLLTAAARHLTDAEYGRSTLAAVAKFDLLPVYFERGYLKAEFGPSETRVVPQPAPAADATGPAEIEVDAIVPVTPGKVYSTSGVDWKGNASIATADVAPLVHLPPGQPADAVRLSRDLASVGKLYRSRGYMAAEIKPATQFDDDKGTVHYDFNVVEGDLYRMGELEITGLDTQAKSRMVDAWTLREGQPYNADYPKKYLNDTGQLLPRGVHWGVTVHETPDAKDKTVDVEIRFKQE
jgi:outer membrane protein assembly factor BamA